MPLHTATHKAFNAAIVRGKTFLDRLVAQQRLDEVPTLNLDLLAAAFHYPPNKYSSDALLYFIIQECCLIGKSQSTARVIRAAFCHYWEEMDGGRWSGEYHLDGDEVFGCPARSADVEEVVQALRLYRAPTVKRFRRRKMKAKVTCVMERRRPYLRGTLRHMTRSETKCEAGIFPHPNLQSFHKSIIMGIHNLWSVVKTTRAPVSLVSLCARGFVALRGSKAHCMIIGVDLNNLLDACVAITHKQLHAQLGPHAVHRLFFYRLCSFLKVPARFIFVSDGPGRPKVKRGHQVKTKELWYLEDAVKFIIAFGFHYHKAPGEAEAELGRLNAEGLIDAVITEDSDVLLFKAKLVLRRVPRDSTLDSDVDSDYYAYDTNDLKDPSGRQLTLGDLLLYALLVGGDYDPRGIEGCGSVTAVALAHCGYGEKLYEARKQGLCAAAYQAFLTTWRAKLKLELTENPHAFLARREPKIADNITEDFPNAVILDNYLAPLTSWTPTGSFPVDISRWLHREPTLPDISQLCSKIWEPEHMKRKYKHFFEEENWHLKTPHIHTHIIEVGAQVGRGVPNRSVVISTKNFVTSMAFNDQSDPKDLTLDIPECLLLGMGLVDDDAVKSSLGLTSLPMDGDWGRAGKCPSSSRSAGKCRSLSLVSPIASSSRSALEVDWLNTTAPSAASREAVEPSNIDQNPIDATNTASSLLPLDREVIDLTDPDHDLVNQAVASSSNDPYVNVTPEVIDLTGPEPVAFRVRTLNYGNVMEILDD
ncbi:hypothetical protein H0H93_008552 [Arthromyces matolae]|nr:hypothetical protein H0H93_008552 [Arthromyces matolae]